MRNSRDLSEFNQGNIFKLCTVSSLETKSWPKYISYLSRAADIFRYSVIGHNWPLLSAVKRNASRIFDSYIWLNKNSGLIWWRFLHTKSADFDYRGMWTIDESFNLRIRMFPSCESVYRNFLIMSHFKYSFYL